MKKISVLLSTFIIVATSLTSCKKADVKSSNESDSVTVVTDSISVDSVSVDTTQTK